MFQNSIEYKEIEQELRDCNILHHTARFVCYSDNIFTYHIIFEGLKHELSVIADETFLYEMTVNELLDLNRVNFFSHTVYDNCDDSKLGGISYVRETLAELN